MHLTSLTVENIRNHVLSHIEFARGVNVLCGLNGQGKTSLLEAVALCALSQSFVRCSDAALIRRGAEWAQAAVAASTDLETPYKVSVKVSLRERKHITSSLGKRLTPQDIIGEMPLVVLSPDYRVITAGTPEDRRRFINSILSQASKLYMEHVLTMKRILKQRNSMLNSMKLGMPIDTVLLDTWTEQFIAVSAEIAVRRWEFVREFTEYMQHVYARVSQNAESVALQYDPHSLPKELFYPAPNIADIRAEYSRIFERIRREEYRRGTTLVGPHKDELVFSVDGGLARECASQGQHKTLLIALKTAEFEYLRDLRRETPIVLLDDIFSELDTKRAANVIALLESGAQTLLTTTDERVYREYVAYRHSGEHALFAVSNGVISYIAS
ncbi:MAG: DNA replication and repair protein RecF [Bacteroidota bacterium]|nr:DNA replication and repair protein RecF [Candidatus Kapabacteria bacterium]MDW8219961.1 DNA replication and repair protein RecF [Bacteroidota bacterium]